MKRQLRLLCGLGSISLLVMGTSVSSSYAGDKCRPKNPLRGTYVFSQVAYVVPGVTGPVTEVGTVNVDDCGNLTGHGVIDASTISGFEFDFDGACVIRASGSEIDCTLSALGTTNIGRYCVMTRKGDDGCFEKWRCISSNPVSEPGVVLLADVERQQSGTCK